MFFKEKLETQNKALRCPLLMSQNEDDCHDIHEEASNFFSDTNVMKRIQNCSTYFTQINTVARTEVKVTSYIMMVIHDMKN